MDARVQPEHDSRNGDRRGTAHPVMLGLDPSIQELLGDRIVEVVPVWVRFLNQVDLPGAGASA